VGRQIFRALSSGAAGMVFFVLFQFLKLFPGRTEIWGAIIIPALVMESFLLCPFSGAGARP